jgi:hypothetical protein
MNLLSLHIRILKLFLYWYALSLVKMFRSQTFKMVPLKLKFCLKFAIGCMVYYLLLLQLLNDFVFLTNKILKRRDPFKQEYIVRLLVLVLSP